MRAAARQRAKAGQRLLLCRFPILDSPFPASKIKTPEPRGSGSGVGGRGPGRGEPWTARIHSEGEGVNRGGRRCTAVIRDCGQRGEFKRRRENVQAGFRKRCGVSEPQHRGMRDPALQLWPAPAPAGCAAAARQRRAFSALIELSRKRGLATPRVVAPAKAGVQGSWPQPQESRIPVCTFARTASTRGPRTRPASTTPARRRRVQRLSANRQCGSRTRWLVARRAVLAITRNRKPREPGGALGAWGPEGGRGEPVLPCIHSRGRE